MSIVRAHCGIGLALAALVAATAQAGELGLQSYLRSPYDPTPDPVLIKAVKQADMRDCTCRVRESAQQGPGDREIAQATAQAREYYDWFLEDQRTVRAEQVQVP